MKILVTGFEPFQGVPENPSGVLMSEVEQWHPHDTDPAGYSLKSAVLPTEYEGCETRMKALLEEFPADVVLGTGVHKERELVHLESTAVNLDDSKRADNAGVSRHGTKIIKGGEGFLKGNLEWEYLISDLGKAGIQAVMSHDAGFFVCNHYYYWLCHRRCLVDFPHSVGFVHLPVQDSKEDLQRVLQIGRTTLRVVLEGILSRFVDRI
ncbi:hypothetical protein HOF92_01630 [bacterium]|jgi:pyroglutamyl-peptidase|nr:hypothetical protein [bacterium]